MASRPKRRPQLTAPGVEVLRLCHLGLASGDKRKQDAALSILSLLALQLKQEMIVISEDMAPHYKALLK